MKPTDSVKNIEWWEMSDGAKQTWYFKWWVMSYEWWVMSDENWVTKKMNPNNPLTTKFCVFLFWVKWGRLEKPAFEIFRSGLKADLGQKKKKNTLAILRAT